MSLDPNQKPNPLDAFRTYSYQHILLVANNTDALRPFISLNSGSNIRENTRISNDVLDNLRLGEELNGVFKVIDTRKDSEFSIRDITYTTHVGAMIPGQTQVLTGTLNMTVVDPLGITFLNYLQNLMDEKLMCNFDGMCFLLKTLFIGHPDDGSDNVLISTSANSLLLMNIDADFTEMGGVYQVKFAPLACGAAQQMQRTAAIQNVQVFTSKDRTLGTMVKNLETSLNDQLKDYYDKLVVTQITERGVVTSTTNANRDNKLGRRVYYMITIPDHWKAFEVEAGSDKAIEVEWKNKVKSADAASKQKVDDYNKNTPPDKNGKNTGPAYIAGSVTMTVDDALSIIFKHCPKVAEMASIAKRKDTDREGVRVYKTISTMTSNADSVTLHWDVVEFVVPNISKKAAQNSAYKHWFTADGTPKNLYTYDYIFSGKNTDILTFEMKLQNANIALLQSVNVGQKALQTIATPQKSGGAKEAKTTKPEVFTQRTKDPVFIPMVNSSNLRGNSYIVDGSALKEQAHAEYVRTMADLYATSTVDLKMRIRGNPNLMNQVTFSMPPHATPDVNAAQYLSFIKDYTTSVQTEANAVGGNMEAANSLSPAVFPIFTKVNIYSPDKFRANASDTQFGSKFWYDKYYMVRSIDHKFADGLFEQELVMGAYNIYDSEVSDKALELNTKAATTAAVDKTAATEPEKFKAGSSLSAPSAPGMPASHPISDTLSAMGAGASKAVSDGLSTVTTTASDAYNSVKRAASGVIDDASAVVNGAVTTVSQAIGDVVNNTSIPFNEATSLTYSKIANTDITKTVGSAIPRKSK